MHKSIIYPFKFTLLKLFLLEGEINLSSSKSILFPFIPFGGLTVSFQSLPISQQVIYYHFDFKESYFLTITSLPAQIDTF